MSRPLFIFLELVAIVGVLAPAKAQSLEKERIDRLRKSVVRISVDSTATSGTAFFIDSNGTLVTCWHVVEPMLIFDSAGNVIRTRKLYIEQVTGNKYEVSAIASAELVGRYRKYDYCLLKLKKGEAAVFKPLKLGRFNNITEGDGLYTAGYPLGIQQQVVAIGILSTKFTDFLYEYTKDNKGQNQIVHKFTRQEAWMDLTLNKGNSGGPIIKKGATPDDDKVIGIADFILSPGGKAIEQVYTLYASGGANMDILYPGGISQNTILMAMSQALLNCSVGVSGCVAIDHIYMSK